MSRPLGTPPQMSPGSRPAGDGNRVRRRWAPLALIAAAGALLLALFVAPSGSTVAVTGALTIAGVLAAIAAVAFLRRRAAGGQAPGGTGWGHTRQHTPHPVPGGVPGVAPTDASSSMPPGIAPVRPDHVAPAIPPVARGGAGDFVPLDKTSEEVAAICRRLAQTGVEQMSTAASSVLILHRRRLVPAGTAGDWALARRLLAETRADAPVWQGGAVTGAVPLDAGEPPQFPMDDTLPLRLAVYQQAIPMERWEELEDAPPDVLPLAGLADHGTGVAVPLGHGREFVGLWVLARRPKGRPYSDAELHTLERAARQVGPALSAALHGSGR